MLNIFLISEIKMEGWETEMRVRLNKCQSQNKE